MMTRQEFLRDHPEARGEMVVYTRDGEKLGTVTALNEDSMNIEKGFFFPKDFLIRYDDVVDIHGNELIIDRQRKELSEWKSAEYEGWNKPEALGKGGDIEIPLFEEELHANKRMHQAGEVHLKKVVHTETQSFTIPVSKEEIVIEHTPGGTMSTSSSEADIFAEQETTIPLMEEEVELSRDRKLRETVHARKVSHTEQQEMSGDIKKEDLEVETTEVSPHGGIEKR